MKKILCLVLSVILVCQLIVPVFADTSDTIGNTAEENRTILEKLQKLYGDDLTEDDVLKELSNMGLLDDNGNLNVSESIMVDGTPMTLDQVKVMLDADDADLGKRVNVDGTLITLADLKKMIEIEDELARIRESYFSNAVPFTEEHNASFNSLLKQIENEGILVTSSLPGAESSGAAINHDLRIKVSGYETRYTQTADFNLHFSIVDANGNPVSETPGYDISFDWRLLDGSAKRGIHYNKGTGVPEGTVTFTNGQTSASAVVSIDLTTYGEDNASMRWNGDKTFLIQLSKPVNALFEGNTRAKDIPVTINKAYTWKTGLYRSIWVEDIPSTEKNPNTSGAGIAFGFSDGDRTLMKYAADDIFGSISDAYFEFSPYVRLMQESGSNDEFNYTLSMKPMLVDSEGLEVANAQYYDFKTGQFTNYKSLTPYSLPVQHHFHVGDPSPSGSNLYARFAGSEGLPEMYYIFTDIQYNPSYPYSTMALYYSDVRLEMTDNEAPTVKNITAPAGNYYSGQVIPITVEFSEPVAFYKYSEVEGYYESVSIETGSKSIPVSEGYETVSKYATFLYTVPDNPNNALVINSVSNIMDIKGNRTDSWRPANGSAVIVKDVTMSPDPLNAFTGLSLNNKPGSGVYAPDGIIDVRLDADATKSLWLDNDYDSVSGQLKTVYIKVGNHTYPLNQKEEGAWYLAQIPAADHAGTTQQSINIGLYTGGSYIGGTGAEPAHFEGGSPVIGIKAAASIAPLILADIVDIDESTYPENNIIYLAGTKSIQLRAAAVSSSGEAPAYPEIRWESSNNLVAEITNIDVTHEKSGVIIPHGKGKVKFTAVAKNGRFGSVYAETPEFIVKDGGPPAIVFPEGNNAFVTRKNEEVRIAWGQNLIDRIEGVATEFTLEIYEGEFPNIAEIAGTPVHNAKVTDANYYTVPANTLAKVSDGTDPAYTVKVSAANPENPADTLGAIGYIIIYPQPARVKLNKLDSYYITDETTSLNIGWTLTNFVNGELDFKIVKNQEVIPAGAQNTGDIGSYTLDIGSVPEGSLKDIYTVAIKAKNTQDSAWSTDSFVLHVYNKNSMKILADNQDQSSLLMDNSYDIKGKTSEEILMLNRNISLKNDISINYNDYPWGNITDQIEWESSDSQTASVNYRQGTLYENVEKFDYSSYRPSTKFMLAGNSDGDAVITATHAATGMKDTLDVTVKTLKDKLYIFNFYPQKTTILDYINGDGEPRSLTTNEDGEIAIYEESGIASDITLKSGTPEDLYLGTLYNDKLVTSERDPGIYELYPVNIFRLRPAARVELFFKNSEGEPYSGQVTYRGAVYKNDKLCSETMEQAGEVLTIGSDGRFTINLDSTRFWAETNNEALSASDKLKFIYELIFTDDYYPKLIKVNGSLSVEDIVRFGESVVNLKPVSAEDKYKPFVASQAVDYNLSSGRTIDVTEYKGSVGPGNIYPAADLLTIAAWWGKDKADGYDVKVEDEYGSVITGQKVKTMLYPFATLAYSENITTMNAASLNLGIGEKKGAALSLFSPDGNLLKHVESPFTFTNMVGAPEADDEEKGVKKAAEDLNESGNLDFSASTGGGDKIVIKALDLMAGSSLGGQMMNLQLLATEDPLVYRGLITMQAGVGDTEADDVTTNIGGVEFTTDESLGYDQKKELEKKSVEDLKKELDEAMKKTVSGSADYGITITGYFEVEVRYDNKNDKWSIVVIGGGFDLDALVGYTWTANAMMGPIPVTGEFGVGAAMKLEFRAVKPYGNVPADIKASEVNDFMTALRIKLYINAFGGFGFDYSIIAVKIGVFGEIDLTFNNEFLNRPYLTPHPLGYDKLWAGRLTSSGRVGLKFVAKFLFFSYQAVIASTGYNDKELWRSGNPELIDEWKNSQTSNMLKSAGSSRFINKYALSGELSTVKETAGLEDRSYLSLYERVWGNKVKASMGALSAYGISSASGISTASGMADIQINSYPYANPVVTGDGAILAFMSDSGSTDLNETRASWAMANDSGGYGSPGAFMQEPAEKAYADNNIKIDGTKEFAVAAWEQQRVQIVMDGSLSNEDLSAMINSSEIMVSVFNGSTWTTTSLTDNMVSDMAPVVAAKGGRAIVAWRSVAGNDMPGNPMAYDSADDSILYRVYKNGIWSNTHNLYNGASGNVKGLSAAIMSDGTSAIAYTLDCGTENENPALGYETVCAVVDSNDNLITNLRLTNNDSADENPQIAAVDFGAEEGGEKFVIGWYNATLEGTSDIKLAAVDSSGNIYNGFIDSISSINENSAVKIGDNFRFVKRANMGINDLSLIWTEKYMDYDEHTDSNAEKDCLKAVKFMRDENGKIYLSAALDVAVMDDYTLIDHFDAFAGEKNTVHTVMLSSSYTGELIDEGNGLYTRGSICSMKSAFAVFENDISVQDIYVDCDEIRNDFTVPIQFTIVNMGIAPVNSIKIELLPDKVIKTFTGLNILPNQALVLNIHYAVPDALTGIHDLDYTVEATFSNSDVLKKDGKLNLDVPDTGISRVELISDEQGKRVIQATLQNLSDVPLAGTSNRKVYAGFYTSPEYLDESIVDMREITGDDLLLLDKSALTMRFTYTVPPTGIPKGGIRLYGRIWTEEKQLDDTYDEIIEYYQKNNVRSILLPNPIEANNGNQFLLTVEQENGLSQTTAFITVKNLSMTPSVNGNLMAYLMDADGKIIETKLLATTACELIALSGEESITKEFVFSRLGDRVV